jgi:hypothetical protein
VCKQATKKARISDDENVVALMNKVVKRKCACTIKCLMFDSGHMVFTGGRFVDDVNRGCHSVKQLMPQYYSNTQVVPREERFYQRLGIMMVVTGNTTKTVRTRPKGVLTQTEAIAKVLMEAHNFKTKKTKAPVARTKLCPLMQLADAGRVDAAQKCIQMDPTQLENVDDMGNNAIKRLQAMERTPDQDRILTMLLNMTSL